MCIRDRYEPKIILFPHPGEEHPDHRATAEIVMEAVRRAMSGYMQKTHRPDISLMYEVWTPISRPHVVVDITSVMEKKRTAIQKHRSQVFLIDYSLAVEGLNRYRGTMSATGQYGEAYLINHMDSHIVLDVASAPCQKNL